MKSFPIALILSMVALAGCAKDKSKNAPTTSVAEAALSSNNQCAMMNCQKPKSYSTTTAPTSTSTDVSTPSNSKPAPDATVSPAPKPVAAPAPAPNPAVPVPAPPAVKANPFFLEAQKNAKNVQISCRNGDCDASVGLLTAVLPSEGMWQSGQCTASLVSPDVIVTNGHCIPQDLESAGSDCSNRMWISFVDEPGHPEYDKQVGCSQVLFRRKDGGLDGADYAYLKLERAVNRPVLRQSQAGFENNKTYHLHKFNPVSVSGGTGAQLQKVDCLSLYDSAIFSHLLDARSPTSFMVDCSVIKGNSGSPLLDDQNALRGVVYAFVDKALYQSNLAKNGSTVPPVDELADINVASNFACLNLPSDLTGRSLPTECGDPTTVLLQQRAQANAELVAKLKPAVQTMIAGKAVGHADVLGFGWTFTTSSSELLGVVGEGVPECVKHTIAPAFVNQNAKIHRPFFYVRATYDRYLRASNQSPVWANFEKSAENMHLAKADAANFQLEITNSINGQQEFSGAMGYCRN